MTYEEIVSRVADSLGLDKKLVDKTYKAYWKAVKEHIESLGLKQNLSDEEFEKQRPNINIPSIGKLYVSLDKYHYYKRKGEEINNYIKERYGTTHQEN